MSYIINKTDGTVLTEVIDGTIDVSSTDLTLVGKNASSYGESFNENFVHLLENFASATQPNHPITGQLWYDVTDARLKIYDGNGFKVSGGTIVQANLPSNPVQGDLWIDSKREQLYFYDGTVWFLAGPQYTADQGVSGFNVTTILDTLNKSHVVVLMYVANVIIGLFSKDSFTPLEGQLPGTQFSGSIQAGFNIGTTPGLVFNAPVESATYLKDNNGNLKGTDAFFNVDTDNTGLGTQTIENSVPLILGPAQNNDVRIDTSNFNIIANNINQSFNFKVKTVNGLTGLSIFNPGTVTIPVTGGSGNGTYVTLTFGQQSVPPFPINSAITVAGMAPVSYNNTYVVTACTTTSVSFASTLTTSILINGNITATVDPRVGILTASPQATLEVNGDTIVQGNLTVFGTTTNINSTIIQIDDKNIELASTNNPSDTTANGGGLTLKGTTDKTLNWSSSTGSWTSSENIDLASGKTYKINGVTVLTGTTLPTVTSAPNLTSIGSLTTITSGGLTLSSNTISGPGNILIDPAGNASVDVVNSKIINLATPVSGTDAANKNYVDNSIASKPLGMVISLNNASGGTLTDAQVITLIQEIYPAGEYLTGTICRVHCQFTTVNYSSIPITISSTGSPNLLVSNVFVDKNTSSFVSGSNQQVISTLTNASALNPGNATVSVTRTIRIYAVNASQIWELQPTYPQASSV